MHWGAFITPTRLEIFKFGLYLSFPVGFMYFCNLPESINVFRRQPNTLAMKSIQEISQEAKNNLLQTRSNHHVKQFENSLSGSTALEKIRKAGVGVQDLDCPMPSTEEELKALAELIKDYLVKTGQPVPQFKPIVSKDEQQARLRALNAIKKY